MKGIVDDRCIMLGQYIAESGDTVRGAAMKFKISKSTVHKDVTERLRCLSPQLYKRVKKVLDFNRAERHIRGGKATREKYMRCK